MSSTLALFRELEALRTELTQERQAKNYLKHQCSILKAKVAEQDRQLEGSFHAFRFAEARAVMAEMENADLKQRLRELTEDEHRRTGQIAS